MSADNSTRAAGHSAADGQPWTIARLLNWTRDHFKSRGLDEPRLCAEILLAKALDCPRVQLYARFDAVPTPAQLDVFRANVREAARLRPIAYLTGSKEFYGLDFRVTPDVLIPRPETELLVDHALEWCKNHPQDRYDILDVGTGSGCIAVSIAKRQPAAHLVATDVSDAALAVAAENARRHGVESRVACLQADLLDLPTGDGLPHSFDLIVSNPPYVAESRPDLLAENVRAHEPAVALFGGPDGLACYQRLAKKIRNCLKPGGGVILEVGYDQAEAVEALVTAAGLSCLGRYRDLRGILRALVFGM